MHSILLLTLTQLALGRDFDKRQQTKPSATTTQVASPPVATSAVPLTTTGAAPAAPTVNATAPGASSGVLPFGLKEIKQFPTSDFCKQFAGKIQEADGVQRKAGGQTCSSTPLGLIPPVDRMFQTLIVQPASMAELDATVNNTVVLQTNNLEAGFFNDPNSQYYLSPGTLNPTTLSSQGHQHVTVQFVDGLTAPPDPKVFAIFKGINDASVDPARKRLQMVIPAGTIKQNGVHRICTLSGNDGHAGVLSPVLAHGSPDDCIRVTFKNAVSAFAGAGNVADDSAQNVKVTVNGQATNIKASVENSGMSAGGLDMKAEIAAKAPITVNA